jgi:hypothetical protein
MLAGGFIAWSVVAVLLERRWLAVILVLIGSLVHEVAFIFGGPLLTALFLHDVIHERMRLRKGILLVSGLLLLFGLIVVLQSALAPPPNLLASQIMHEVYRPNDSIEGMWRDLAVYMAIAGKHAIGTAMCLNFDLNPNYLQTMIWCILILSCYLLVLPLWKKPLLFALSAGLPVSFMLIIANDAGRWLDLGVLNSWLLAAFLIEHGESGLDARAPYPIAGALMLPVLVWMGVTTYSDVNAFTRTATNIIGRPYSITFEDWLNTCDPHWRDRLYKARAP